jgi:hypothetical protein
MKTHEQWVKESAGRGKQTQPAGKLKLFRDIQADAMEHAAELCEVVARNAKPEGWTDTVARECAARIRAEVKTL